MSLCSWLNWRKHWVTGGAFPGTLTRREVLVPPVSPRHKRGRGIPDLSGVRLARHFGRITGGCRPCLIDLCS